MVLTSKPPLYKNILHRVVDSVVAVTVEDLMV